MDVAQHGDADQRWGPGQGLWPDVLRGVHVPECLYRPGRPGHDRLCLQFSRLHPGGGYRPPAPHCGAEVGLFGLGVRGGSVHILSEKGGGGLLRR